MSNITSIEYPVFEYKNGNTYIEVSERAYKEDSDYTIIVWFGDEIQWKKEYPKLSTTFDNPYTDLFLELWRDETILGEGTIEYCKDIFMFINEFKLVCENEGCNFPFIKSLFNRYIWGE